MQDTPFGALLKDINRRFFGWRFAKTADFDDAWFSIFQRLSLYHSGLVTIIHGYPPFISKKKFAINNSCFYKNYWPDVFGLCQFLVVKAVGGSFQCVSNVNLQNK